MPPQVWMNEVHVLRRRQWPSRLKRFAKKSSRGASLGLQPGTRCCPRVACEWCGLPRGVHRDVEKRIVEEMERRLEGMRQAFETSSEASRTAHAGLEEELGALRAAHACVPTSVGTLLYLCSPNGVWRSLIAAVRAETSVNGGNGQSESWRGRSGGRKKRGRPWQLFGGGLKRWRRSALQIGVRRARSRSGVRRRPRRLQRSCGAGWARSCGSGCPLTTRWLARSSRQQQSASRGLRQTAGRCERRCWAWPERPRPMRGARRLERWRGLVSALGERLRVEVERALDHRGWRGCRRRERCTRCRGRSSGCRRTRPTPRRGWRAWARSSPPSARGARRRTRGPRRRRQRCSACTRGLREVVQVIGAMSARLSGRSAVSPGTQGQGAVLSAASPPATAAESSMVDAKVASLHAEFDRRFRDISAAMRDISAAVRPGRSRELSPAAAAATGDAVGAAPAQQGAIYVGAQPAAPTFDTLASGGSRT